MSSERYLSMSPGETQEIASKIASRLGRGSILALVGELGSGKTCFVQGLARGLKVQKNFYVNSPSFTILNIYYGSLPLYHFDFYRLSNEREAQDLGLEEYFFGDGISVIEWAEKFLKLLPKRRIMINFKFIDDETREIVVQE